MIFQHRQHAGFSLLELMITIALCALLVGFTCTQFSFLNRWLLRSDITMLRSVCRYLQRCAMTTNKAQYLTFDQSTNSYSFNGHKEKLSSAIRFGFISGVKGPPSSPNRELSSPITFKQQQIVFYPDGIISAGTVYLVDADAQVLYALSCSVAHVSYLRTYLYNDGWKLIS